MYQLTVKKHKRIIYQKNFHYVDNAYFTYLDNFSTIGDWLYYLRVAHMRLDKVTDKRTMEAIFRNVFKNAKFIEIPDEKR